MPFVRVLSAVLIGALLSACGGGGGGGTTGGVYTFITTPTPTPPGSGNMGQQSAQRADAQSGISGVQAARSFTGSTTTYARIRALRAFVKREGVTALFGPRARYGIGPCTSGQETSTTAGPNNTAILEIDTFYDSLCANIESKLVWTASQSGSNLTGPALSTQYAQNGTVTETDTMSITFYLSGQTLTGFSMLVSSIVKNGSQVGQAGVACTATSSTAVSCGVADANNVATGEVGANVSASVSVAATTTMSMQVSAYQSSSTNALAIAALSFPYWSISPASDQTQSVSITGSASTSALSLTVSDAVNGGTLSIAGSPTGAISGTLTRNDTGAAVATFTLDGFGNGTLTYGDGTQVSILNYAVQG